jgi:hypothetical protein
VKSQRRRVPSQAAAVAVVAVLAAAGCGGSSKPKPRAQAIHANRTTTTPTSFSVGVGAATARISATLTALGNKAVVGKGWPYSVRVTDRSGRPLSGTVRIRFVSGVHVLGTDTPSIHPLKGGRWSDSLLFPKASGGLTLTFQVVVNTSAGSVTLSWPVSVKS